MKLAGLLLTGASFILFAYTKLRLYSARLEDAQSAVRFLRLLRSQLSFQAAPMQDMFSAIAERSGGRERGIFRSLSEDMNKLGEKSFHDIWGENICRSFCQLAEDERYELIKLGEELGLCPVDMQISALTRCETGFCERLMQEKDQYPQIRKLYMWLAAAAGAAVIIVFI